MAKFRAICIGVIAYFCSSLTAYSQTLTGEEKLEWFVDRIPLSAVYGIVAGAIIALGWLRRVKYVPENLSIDRQVRRRFVGALIVSLIIFAAALWTDLWLFSSFETIIQGPMEGLTEMLSLSTLFLTAVMSVMVYLMSFLLTRGAFSGRYALRPAPRRR